MLKWKIIYYITINIASYDWARYTTLTVRVWKWTFFRLRGARHFPLYGFSSYSNANERKEYANWSEWKEK